MRRTCNSMAEVVDVFNHNTEIFDHAIRRINGKIARLEKKNHSRVCLGIIFGTVIELCVIQNRKIVALDERIDELNTEIKELKYAEGE